MGSKRPDIWNCNKSEWDSYMKTKEYQDDMKQATFMEEQRKERAQYWIDYRMKIESEKLVRP